ncbi:hypothetical protein [Pedobacter namyangjuensis]|uniref:hypothetical protein n=1 Tax=Pedobacter namyangjuensis TaxID=600626 RepID=UPI0013B3B52D|nr:hypothetical protein [Pedobacter namyangjuensis]
MKKPILTLIIFAISMLATLRLFAQQSKFEMNGTCSFSQAGDCRMASDPFEVKITLDIDQKTGRIAME